MALPRVVLDIPDAQVAAAARDVLASRAWSVTEAEGGGGPEASIVILYRAEVAQALILAREARACEGAGPIVVLVTPGDEQAALAALTVEIDDYVVIRDGLVRLGAAVLVQLQRLDERARAATQARLDREFLERLPVGIYRTTPEGRVLDANLTCVEMLGFESLDDFKAVRTPELYMRPEDRTEWRRRMERDGVISQFETEKRRRDGSPIWLRDSARVVRDQNGEVLYYEGAVIDVTPQRDAESALRRSRAEARSLLDAIPDAVLRLDATGACIDANLGSERLLERAPSQLIGATTQELVGADLAKRILGWLSEDRTEEREFLAEHDWSRKTLEVRLLTSTREDSLLIVRDTTDATRVKEHLLRSDRLASVGLLAAGVAHEINNPLAYSTIGLDLVSEGLEELLGALEQDGASPSSVLRLRELRRAATEAGDGIQRVRRIVRDLRAFSTAESESIGPVDAAAVVESAIDFTWNEIRHRARVVRELGTVPSVRGNASRLGQVFVNLLLNAAQAIPVGSADENEIEVRVATEAGGVVVEISDTGTGISAEDLPRIFEPFFTTKTGAGTGLGLSICHNIVTSLGGRLTAASEPGKGTALRVWLARHEGAGADTSPSSDAIAGGLSVLIVDDEALVCSSLERALTRQCEVMSTTSATAALEAISSGGRFDLILCDLMMPAISGDQLYLRIQAIDPSQADRLVFMTGGAFSEEAQAFLARSGRPCLDKPFSVRELRSVVAQAQPD